MRASTTSSRASATSSSARTCPTTSCRRGDAGSRRDAADRPGAGAGRRPAAQPRDVRDHVDGAGGPADHRTRACTATSSTTPSTRARPRSSSAASACWPTCSTRRARPRARARRVPPRRSCSARWRSSGSGASGARRPASPPTGRTSSSAATCTSCGRSSAATSTSSRGSCPLQEGKYTIGPEDVEPHVDENTIGVAAVLGTTFTGHADDIAGSTTCSWS